jgi:hypothetical protein
VQGRIKAETGLVGCFDMHLNLKMTRGKAVAEHPARALAEPQQSLQAFAHGPAFGGDLDQGGSTRLQLHRQGGGRLIGAGLNLQT